MCLKGLPTRYCCLWSINCAKPVYITLDKSPCKLLDVQTSSLARKIKENSLIDAI